MRTDRSLGIIALLLTGALFVSCTGEEEPTEEEQRADPRATGELFVEAWNSLDETALSELASSPTDVPAFVRAIERSEKQGLITGFSASLSGELDAAEPTPGSEVSVPYSIEWTSEAMDAPATLSGEFSMTYASDDSWSVDISKSLLWPGIGGAKGFDVVSEWEKRGRLLDTMKKILAKGAIDERSYPQGSVAGTTVGHIGPLTKADVKEGAEGMPGDLVGASGLEQAFQDELAGTPTLKLLVVGRKGKKLEKLGTALGTPGTDVRTTLDIDVQRAAESAYGSTVGGAVVIDPEYGRPSRGRVVVPVRPEQLRRRGRYPTLQPRSVGAVSTRILDEGGHCCGCARYEDRHARTRTSPARRSTRACATSSRVSSARIDFATAVKFSVNTAFAQVAEDLGAKKMTKYAESFGFNGPPDDGAGGRDLVVPLPRGPRRSDVGVRSVRRRCSATPLQMATVAATIANDGKRMEPRIDRVGRPHR